MVRCDVRLRDSATHAANLFFRYSHKLMSQNRANILFVRIPICCEILLPFRLLQLFGLPEKDGH